MVFSFGAIVLYLLAMLRQLALYRGPRGQDKKILLLLAVLAGVLHACLLYRWIDLPVGQNLSVVNLFSVACWLVAMALCILVVFRPVEMSVIVAFPITAMSIVLVGLFPSEYVVTTPVDLMMLFHIVISMLAFCVLCLASLMAILLALQERLLRYKCFSLLNSLPSIQVMESLLFQLITLGWILLSVVIGTSFYCYSHWLALPRVMLKVIMAVLSWLIFSILALGRYVYNWRGSKVIYATIIGVLLLAGVYCGSKIILESIFR